jgi:23S rRNA (pseudouridine1915-N3)-methyltransferase
MRISLIAVGRRRRPYQDDVEHIRKMLAGHVKIDQVEVREDEKVPPRIPDRALTVLLASDGRMLSSEEFSDWLEERRRDGRDVCFVVGGPKGLDIEADLRMSLGPMTLPHQLARVVLLEQLYRAHKILAREPYHY